MEIAFRTRELQRTLGGAAALNKTYGTKLAKVIMMRMGVLKAVRSLSQLPTTPPERRHQLSGSRDEQFAVNLVHPKRLVFEAIRDPVPRTKDGGVDVEQVSAITALDVLDYHLRREKGWPP